MQTDSSRMHSGPLDSGHWTVWNSVNEASSNPVDFS